MLYYLFNYLDQLDFPGAGMFKYVSFRSGLALILSLFISTAIGRRIIDKLRVLQIGETVRDLGLEGQLSKKGTPTMGGIIIIIAILIPVLLCAKLTNIYVILMVVTTVWLGALGFADDYIKVFQRNKDGMHGQFKIVGQVGLGLIVGLVLFLSPDVVIRENMEVRHDNVIEEVRFHAEETKSTKTTIPFVKNNNFDYASLVSWAGDYKQEAAWLVFVLMVIFVVTAVSNGANMTDGLDGLAAMTRAPVQREDCVTLVTKLTTPDVHVRDEDIPDVAFEESTGDVPVRTVSKYALVLAVPCQQKLCLNSHAWNDHEWLDGASVGSHCQEKGRALLLAGDSVVGDFSCPRHDDGLVFGIHKALESALIHVEDQGAWNVLDGSGKAVEVLLDVCDCGAEAAVLHRATLHGLELGA